MAAGLDIAASIISLVEFSGRVLCAGYTFLGQVKRAPTQIRYLLSELANINTLLDQLRSAALDSPHVESLLTTLLLKNRKIEECQILLVDAQKCLSICEGAPGHAFTNLRHSLLWPFKEQETREMFERLRRMHSDLLQALDIDVAASVKRIERLNTELRKELIEASQNSENEKLIAWICPLDLDTESDYTILRMQRHEGTGTMFVRSMHFLEWVDSGNILWLSGPPGSGKTVLSTSVIDWLHTNRASVDIALCYFFCDYRQNSKRQINNFLMALVRQLLQRNEQLSRDVSDLFRVKSLDTARAANRADYLDLICKMVQHFERVYVVLDGLDEADLIETWVSSLKTLVFSSVSKLRVLITSRRDINIEQLLTPVCSHQTQLAEIARLEVDRYIRIRVDHLLDTGQLELRKQSLADDIKKQVILRADGLFLAAKLHLDLICSCLNDGAVKMALTQLPTGLYNTYERILRKLVAENTHNLREVKLILRWLICSTRPLTLAELAEAVALDQSLRQLNLDAIATNPKRLLSTLSSLVIIQRHQDDEVAIFAHLSIREYFLSQELKQSELREFHVDKAQTQRFLSLACLRYLLMDDFRYAFFQVSEGRPLNSTDRPVRNRQRLPLESIHDFTSRYALLSYAVIEWPIHVREAFQLVSVQPEIRNALHWFLNPDYTRGHYYWFWHEIYDHFAPARAIKAHKGGKPQYIFGEKFQPPLLFALWFNLEPCFKILAEGCNLDFRFSGGMTPLTLATECGATELARKMITSKQISKIDLHEMEIRDMTPLHIAAEYGDLELVSLLLENGASVHSLTSSRTTPFYRAMRGDSTEVVELLYKAGSDINARTWDNWTPLIEAISSRFDEVVPLLLTWGADKTILTDGGNSALSMAQEIGNTEMERILLASSPGIDTMA